MKKEKTKFYKFFVFDNSILKYVGIPGIYSLDDSSLNCLLLSYLTYFKIPFFGYHSPQFTALDPRGLAVNEKPEV